MTRQEIKKAPQWPGRAAATGLALLLLLFLLPLLLLPEEGEEGRETPDPLPTATLPILTPAEAEPVPGWDEGEKLRLLKSDGTVEELTLADYLWGVVAAEMPASFQLEALKAQVVAARTYCLYQRAGGGDKHPGADVCTDYTCCQAYLTREQAAVGWGDNTRRYADKLTQAVEGTDGLLCLYEGKPIDAVFFSSTAGSTNDAQTVWGASVPYLTAVASPEGEEVPGWRTEVDFTPEEFSARLRSAAPEADLAGNPTAWIGELTAGENGVVTSVVLGGVPLSGGQARSVFGLRSAHFTVSATAEQIRFQVTGYGHGVGLSQYGANALAAEGKTFQEILRWYYTGVTVAPAP